MFPFSNKAYSYIRWVASTMLPLAITSFAGIWAALSHYGTLEADLGILIVAIMGFVNAFLGGLVGISTAEYNRQRLAHFEGAAPAPGTGRCEEG